ncbi:MAG: HD domain-containing protein [Alphaproteobacteria bacterium]|nr:HD domain-containing protein [Alphaproteobacteria bacterium]
MDYQHNLAQEFLEFVEQQPRQSLTQLLSRVLRKSRMLTGAEAGTIFIVRRKRSGAYLQAVNAQNDRIRVNASDFEVPVSNKTISGYVGGTGETVIIDDVYHIDAAKPYSFNPAYEAKNYKSITMLCFPLKNYTNHIIGVAQLINRLGPGGTIIPFDPHMAAIVGPVARVVGTSIERTDMMDQIRHKNKVLQNRNRQLADQRSHIGALQEQTEEAFLLSVGLLARAAEIHDEGTGNHIVRTNEYSFFIAQHLGMPKEFCDEIHYSAQLHDVGKMSVDQAVLKKKGRLDDLERAEMDRHTTYGHQILCDSPRLQLAAEIALSHHEKWAGTGYPNGLGGADIPVSARIVQVADIYDALRSERPYKAGFSHEKAMDIILNGDDRLDPREHFDPRVIELFADTHLGFAKIWDELKDPPGAAPA